MQQVRYFLAVCEEQNFTRAAKRCGVAQPSLSVAIRELERHLGGPLFHRGVRSAALTELGRAVRPHLRAVARAADAAGLAAQWFKLRQARNLRPRYGGREAAL